MSETIGRFFVPVDRGELQYNHAEKLKFWLDEGKFELFRNRISVDNYLAITKDGRQFYPFAMCRESNSDNYTGGTPTAYYLTTEDAQAIVDYIKSEV